MNGARIEERKRKVKEWLGNKNNILIIAVILAAFLIRVYYLFATKGQPLWWDEAEYMATAKHWVFGIPYSVNPQRPPLFQLFGAVLLWLGLGETMLKFILVVLPSTFLVLSVYLAGKELFNEKIGIFAAAATAFMWSFLFWSVRFQPDYFSLAFQMIAITFFWKTTKTNKNKYAIYAGIFAALGFYFKISALLVPLSFIGFAIFKERISFLKEKKYWLMFLAFLTTMIPFMIWQFLNFGNPVAFAPSYISGTGIGQGWDFGWMTLRFFYSFPGWLFFILFIIGAGISIFNIIISFDIIEKDKKKRNNPEAFSLIILMIMTLFYIFYIRGVIEDRWVFLLAPFIFYLSAKGAFRISRELRKFGRVVPVIFLILIFGVFLYSQIQHASAIINNKKDSYLPVKDAALWMKDNSNPGDKILTISYTQTVTYSELNVSTYSKINGTKEFNGYIQKNKPRYLEVSIFEPHPRWIYDWIKENQNIISPVRAYFSDPNKKQPILIVYELKYKQSL